MCHDDAQLVLYAFRGQTISSILQNPVLSDHYEHNLLILLQCYYFEDHPKVTIFSSIFHRVIPNSTIYIHKVVSNSLDQCMLFGDKNELQPDATESIALVSTISIVSLSHTLHRG